MMGGVAMARAEKPPAPSGATAGDADFAERCGDLLSRLTGGR